jgi:alginate O-acetyltransferase complex protein AlgI
MLFNSLPFALFLPVVFAVYWSLRKAPLRIQNLFVLFASYFFYGWWDWRFLSLIVASSTVDYLVGRALHRTSKPSSRKKLLAVSVAANLGLLGTFKYYDFFVSSFCDLLERVGLHASPHLLGVVIPVGISFYTFQTLSYTIDVYRRRIEPTGDVVAFFAFVSFFPQLVAGPIERARNLLPQFLRRREFDDAKARDGMRQMLSGFMKKMLVADNLAPMVDQIFGNYRDCSGPTLLAGVFLFAMQIYCDFSGYSDIAIGCARLFGIDLMRNFAFPYFSRDIVEFWRRWHISLSTWLRDYVYVPLCGTRPTRKRKAVSIVVTFTACGLWHGASQTFVFWGLLNGLYFLPYTLARRRKRFLGDAAEGRLLPNGAEAVGMMTTSLLVGLGWIFFRSQSLAGAIGYIKSMVFSAGWSITGSFSFLAMLALCIVLLVAEWLMRRRKHLLEIGWLPVPVRWSIYILVLVLVLTVGVFRGEDFIYFQF